MAIVKSIRGAGGRIGRLLDAEDRRVMGQAGVLVFGGGSIVLAAAGIAGLAWRLFWLAAG